MAKLGFSSGFNTVVTAWISSDGHYAFVEFRTVEETNAALIHLNGMQVGAYQFKVGRPRGYTGGSSAVAVPMASAAAASTAILNASALGSNNPLLAVTGMATPAAPTTNNYAGSNYLMVTNLPLEIPEEQVKDLVAAFGEVISST
jgi:splicing factor U2AF subunit